MPIKESAPGSGILLFFCEVCRKPAQFGYAVDLRKALDTKDARHAGKWYCAEHRPEFNPSSTPEAQNAPTSPAGASDANRLDEVDLLSSADHVAT